MKRFSWFTGILMSGFTLASCVTVESDFDLDFGPEPEPPEWSIVIHGGAGVITREAMSPETEAAYIAALQNAIDTGSEILASGGPAIDAVETVIRGLEDDPLFNAGRGAVMTETGEFSLDSSIMDGDTLNAGAVASLTNVRHPISAARKAMEESPHVMLAGAGADQFAAEQGLEIVDPVFFFTERRWKSLLRVLDRRGVEPPPRPEGAPEAAGVMPSHADLSFPDDQKFGTVGVVAMDQTGNIVAGTSTGGTTAKRWGRVGDSPIIGAGTYAKSGVCGISSTGTGEYFIRLAVAYAICARIEQSGESAQEAADHVIHTELTGLGGDGGIVMLGPDGRPNWSFNTEGMYRAYATSEGDQMIEIYEYNEDAFE